MPGALSAIDVDLGESFYNDPESELAEALVDEFTRLFIGPGRHISAHELIFTKVDLGGLWWARTV